MQGRNVYVRGVGFRPFGRHPEKFFKRIAASAAFATSADIDMAADGA